MTKWERDAREAGHELYRQNPGLPGPEVDRAATAYSPFSPCRRWFQEGFHFAAKIGVDTANACGKLSPR
jgi:hypothetical protein